MSLSRRTLRAVALARKRPALSLLGTLDTATVDVLLAYYDEHKHQNVIGEALENRSVRSFSIGNKAELLDNYAQIELQGLRPGGDPDNRRDYTMALHDRIMAAIAENVGKCYRSRISTLRPGGVIGRHLDDPEQLRVISVLRGSQVFRHYVKSECRLVEMGVGELWYVNTAWEHTVENKGDVDRVALLLNLFELPEQGT